VLRPTIVSTSEPTLLQGEFGIYSNNAMKSDSKKRCFACLLRPIIAAVE